MADQDHSKDFTTRTVNGVPSRTDNRGVLHMLHDEIGKALGIGRAKDVNVNDNGQRKGLMDAVDDAISGANEVNARTP
jgi:hypothetical protein